MSQHAASTRRSFVTSMTGALCVVFGIPRPTHDRCGTQAAVAGPHPDPRPDVDASKVLTHDQLGDNPSLVTLYDGIREIPHIADGIRCQCGCADLPTFRSLLTCFESNGMAMSCEICQTEGRLVVRLHGSGRTLVQIRRAVDARFG